jgi:hypothetical protein
MHENDPVVHVQVFDSGVEVTVKLVMTDPPFDDGAVHVMSARPSPLTALADVGLPGIVEGTTANEGLEAVELPFAFEATTVKV